MILGSIAAGAVLVWLAAGWIWPSTPAEVVEVQRGLIRQFVDERGVTRLPRTYLITMPYSGRIAPITLAEGEPVQKGQPVARIVPEDLKLAVDGAQAMVQRLDAQIAKNQDTQLEEVALKQARALVESMEETVQAVKKQWDSALAKKGYSEEYLKRIQELSGGNTGRVVSEDERQQAELQAVEDRLGAEQAERTYWAAVAMQTAMGAMPGLIEKYVHDEKLEGEVLDKQKAEALVRRDQAVLDENRGALTSPVDGVVLARSECNERALAAGTPLLEIGRLEDLEIEADVLSLDVVDVRKNAKVEIYGPAIGSGLPGGADNPEGRDYANGTVHKIYPAGFTKISSLGVEQQRVKVIIHFNPDDLQWLRRRRNIGVGYRVRVRIHTREDPDALVVPRYALFRTPDGSWNVYAVRDGRVRIEPVEVGILNDDLAEVTSGLKQGDQVVRAPESDLKDGQRVQAVLVQDR